MTVLLEPFAALLTNNFALGYSGLKVGTINDVRKGKNANNYDNNFGWGEIKCIVDFNEVFHLLFWLCVTFGAKPSMFFGEVIVRLSSGLFAGRLW